MQGYEKHVGVGCLLLITICWGVAEVSTGNRVLQIVKSRMCEGVVLQMRGRHATDRLHR